MLASLRADSPLSIEVDLRESRATTAYPVGATRGHLVFGVGCNGGRLLCSQSSMEVKIQRPQDRGIGTDYANVDFGKPPAHIC